MKEVEEVLAAWGKEWFSYSANWDCSGSERRFLPIQVLTVDLTVGLSTLPDFPNSDPP